MASIGKIIVGTGIGAGLIWLISNLLGKKKLGDKLNTKTLANIHSFDVSKGLIIIRIDVILTNPTEYTIQIKQPYVKLLVKDDLLGDSQILNQVIDIKPYSSQKLENPIMVTIPALKLLSMGGGFYKALANKQPVNMTVITYSSINLGPKWIGYEQATPVTLNAPKLPLNKKQLLKTDAKHGTNN